MNVGVMIFTAVITTGGIILITKNEGRRKANYVKKILGLLAIAPFLILLLQLLFFILTDPDMVGAASLAVSDKMISMLPETILSTYIGEAVGFVLWGIYRFFK